MPTGALGGIPLPPGPILVLPVAEPMLVRPLAPRLARLAMLFERRRWSTDGDGFMVSVFYPVGARWGGAQAWSLSSSDRDHLAFSVLTMVTSNETRDCCAVTCEPVGRATSGELPKMTL